MIGYGAIGTGVLLLLLAVHLFRGAFAVRAAADEAPAAAPEEARPVFPAARKRGRNESAQFDLHPRKLEEGEEFALPTRLTASDPLLRPLAPA